MSTPIKKCFVLSACLQLTFKSAGAPQFLGRTGAPAPFWSKPRFSGAPGNRGSPTQQCFLSPLDSPHVPPVWYNTGQILFQITIEDVREKIRRLREYGEASNQNLVDPAIGAAQDTGFTLRSVTPAVQDVQQDGKKYFNIVTVCGLWLLQTLSLCVCVYLSVPLLQLLSHLLLVGFLSNFPINTKIHEASF